jgi:hypothetical protein
MKFHLIVPAFAAVLGLSFACAPAHAQTEAPASSTSPDDSAAAAPTKFKGTITAIDTTANTVTVKSKGGDLTMGVTGKAAKAITKLAVGDKVSGAYTTDASGKLTASVLKKAKPKAPKADAGGDAGGGGGGGAE